MWHQVQQQQLHPWPATLRVIHQHQSAVTVQAAAHPWPAMLHQALPMDDRLTYIAFFSINRSKDANSINFFLLIDRHRQITVEIYAISVGKTF
jgi:hypothetical protein